MFDIDKLNIYWKNFTKLSVDREKVEEAYKSYVDTSAEVGLDPMSIEDFEFVKFHSLTHLSTKEIHKRSSTEPFNEWIVKQNKQMLFSRLLELEETILLHPRNAHHLYLPVVDDIIADAKTGAYGKVYVDLAGNPAEDSVEVMNSFMPHTNVTKSIIFVKGKFGVGVVALGITGHATGQVDRVQINDYYNDLSESDTKQVKPTMLLFEGLENNKSLDLYFDSENNIITEVLSQLLSTQVDNVKNPVGIKLNINVQTLGAVVYLIRRGVGIETIVKFIRQPLIVSYLEEQRINESLMNKTNGNELSKADLILKVLKKHGYYSLPTEFGQWRVRENDLNESIRTGSFDENQPYYLAYFNEIISQSRAFSYFSNDQNADTKGLKDRSAVDNMLLNYENALKAGFIKNTELIRNNGLLSPFTKVRDEYDNMWKRFYIISGTAFGQPLLDFKREVAKLQRTSTKKEKAMSTIDNDFILYFIHKYVLNKPGLYDKLFGIDGGESLAQRVLKAKAQLPNNLVLKAFFPILNSKLDEYSNKYIDSLRLFERELTNIDLTDFIDAVKDIAEVDIDLYTNLIRFLMFQTGTNNSPFNYSKVLPIGKNTAKTNLNAYEYVLNEIFENAIKAMRQSLSSGNTLLDLEQFKDEFLRNNPQFLRTKAFRNYPFPYIVQYNNGKQSIVRLGSGAVPALGSTYHKRYGVGETAFSKSPERVTNEFSQQANISFEENQSSGYREITIKNASADATIAFAYNADTAGEKLTKSSVLEQGKKYIFFSVPRKTEKFNIENADVSKQIKTIVDALNSVNAKTLNIAGNGLYTMKDSGWTQEEIDLMTYKILKGVLESPELINKIESIKTGGQTGFDEAGAKAGIALGIPTKILAPKGWRFRNESGVDISNESQFKNRFNQNAAKTNTDYVDKLKPTDGWKLHLNVKPENLNKVSDFLSTLDKPFKQGNSGGQDGKSFTIYVGSRDAVDEVVSNLKTIENLLELPSQEVLEDDLGFSNKIYGRFDVGSTDKDFHQYGKRGIPILNNDMQNNIFSNTRITSQQIDTADKILKERYGDFYTGSLAPQPSLFDMAGVPEQYLDQNEAEIKKNKSQTGRTLYDEVLNNFETYFPQYEYMSDIQRQAVAEMVENGTIEIKCEFKGKFGR